MKRIVFAIQISWLLSSDATKSGVVLNRQKIAVENFEQRRTRKALFLGRVAKLIDFSDIFRRLRVKAVWCFDRDDDKHSSTNQYHFEKLVQNWTYLISCLRQWVQLLHPFFLAAQHWDRNGGRGSSLRENEAGGGWGVGDGGIPYSKYNSRA